MANVPGRISPDVGNLMVGKGFVIFNPEDEPGVWYHLGNIPKLDVTPKAELLKHYDSQQGTKKKDATIVMTQEMECVMELEEASAFNMRLLFSAAPVNWADPDQPIVTLLSRTQVTGHLKYYATNDVGPRWYIDLPNVTFYPSGGFGAISDQWNSMQVTGTVNYANGTWGTATLQPSVASISPVNIIAPYIDLVGDTVPKVGTTYNVKIGGWVGAVSYGYQWQLGGTGGTGATNITGATGSSFAVTGSTGSFLACLVTATNTVGGTTALTDWEGAIANP